MKCPACNGTGLVYNALGDFEEDCGYCHGTGNVAEPHTNEAWFCGLSTEEKADLLAELVWWIHPSVQGGRKVELTKESFLRWLKEKHE